MTGLRCPKCGVESTGVCAKCYIRDHPIHVKPYDFKQCGCGRVFYNGSWSRDRAEMLKTLAEKSLNASEDVRIWVDEVTSDFVAGQVNITAKIHGMHRRSGFTEIIKWGVRPKTITCETCKKLGSGYYEAVIQVRDEKLDLNLDPTFHASSQKVRGGVDHHLISHEYTRVKVNELISKGYIVQSSSKLFGRKDGADIHRFYFSIKSPPFEKGWYLIFNNKIHLIQEIGKEVKLMDIETKKSRNAKMHKLIDAEIVAKPQDLHEALITEIRPDGMQVLDQFDFKTYDLKLKPDSAIGQTVKLLRHGKKIHIL